MQLRAKGLVQECVRERGGGGGGGGGEERVTSYRNCPSAQDHIFCSVSEHKAREETESVERADESVQECVIERGK